jgi:hypothetical protein
MIKIKTKKRVENMSIEEFSRWGCLVEAYGFIQKRAEELDVDIEQFIKPIAIERYIEERYPSILHDVRCEYELGLL